MEEQFGKRSIFWHYPHYGNQGGTPGSSIRKGDYKLIQFFEDDSIELYNLRDDIGEERNLVDEKHEKAWEMKKELVAWREKINAQIPKENPNYKPYGLAILSKLRWLWEEIKFKLGR